MEFLKEHLGEELFSKVEAKLKGVESLKLGNVASGEYVSKGKFERVEKQLKDTQETIADRDNQLTELKAKAAGGESLQEEIKKLQEANAIATKGYEDKLKKTEFDYALREALVQTHGAKDALSVLPHLVQNEVLFKDNKFTGLDGQIKALKESKGYLFNSESDQIKPGTGGVPNTLLSPGATNEQVQLADILSGYITPK